jgi:prephenate dehydratase
MKVAILGPRGTYSEEAAYKFSQNPELCLCDDISEIFEKVIKEKAEYGIVPVENSLEGSVGMTLELLLKKNLKIYKEIVLDVRHNLMALPGTKINEITEVVSNPQALAQCKSMLRKLKVKTRNFSSTADAAREIAQKKLVGVAAIAPKISAKLYGLEIIEEGIQDQEKNQTRFLVVAKTDDEKGGKTSLILGLKDRPGALYESLRPFAERKINLTKIESRPSRKALGDYIFYIDFEGHRKDERIKEAIEELEKNSLFLKILGSYQKG